MLYGSLLCLVLMIDIRWIDYAWDIKYRDDDKTNRGLLDLHEQSTGKRQLWQCLYQSQGTEWRAGRCQNSTQGEQ